MGLNVPPLIGLMQCACLKGLGVIIAFGEKRYTKEISVLPRQINEVYDD